jgi:hypothetical protein
MSTDTNPNPPAAFSIPGATNYSGFTRTYIYENRDRLDWIKAGRRSLITRASIDRLLLQLLQQTQDRARLRVAAPSKDAQTEPAKPGGGQ